tara:strand:+ start:1092 stop:1322 length:231 start_codon:yes stop_codon:yes gene_type:complete
MPKITIFSERVTRERLFEPLPNINEEDKEAIYQLMPLRKIFMKMESGVSGKELDEYICEMYSRYILQNRHGLLPTK